MVDCNIKAVSKLHQGWIKERTRGGARLRRSTDELRPQRSTTAPLAAGLGLRLVRCGPPARGAARRYDETGLIWLLQGRPVVAMTASEAVIRGHSGATVTYRKFNKPALGPLGDSLDDMGG
jgi:hypothetical protein